MGRIRRPRLIPTLAVLAGLSVVVWLCLPDQRPDPSFQPRVEAPAYPGPQHPHVYFDAGHWNIHTAEGRYKPFAELMRNDGYEIVSHRGTLTTEKLNGYQVLVIANALGWRGTAQQLVNLLHWDRRVHVGGAAFGEAECAAVREWVRQGGALLLIADHAPAGEAAAPLAAALGVGMTNWWAEEPKSHDPETDNWGFLVFSRENGQLLDHAISRGRESKERLTKITTFTGQALVPPPGSVSFLKLSAEAREYPWSQSPDDQFRSAANLAQGVAFECGTGRVVVLGEAAVLSAQLARGGGREFHFGMDWPGSDNRQLALNIMHWLSRALN
ncbi:MAG TPA: hypothetical protein VEH49_05385 [Methylomirabilota bacterium]|nr:hypothetical protein [Methylomirabilota bacterium]